MPTAKLFGARAEISQVSLSPDGDKVAYLAADGARGTAVHVVELTGAKVPRVILRASGDPEQIASCNWVSQTRLICNAYQTLRDGDRIVSSSKLIAINADGTALKRVTIRQGANAQYRAYFGGAVLDLLPGSEGAVLLGRQYVPESAIGSITAKTREGYGVDRVDTLSLASSTVVRPRYNASEYLSDGRGVVRIMGAVETVAGGYAEPKSRYSYRASADADWKPLSVFDWNTETGFNPYAVDPASNVAFGFDRHEGRQALFSIALDGTMKRSLVFSHPQVDVDGLEWIGRQRRAIGVSYATEKRRVEYFDSVMRKLTASLAKALPGDRTIGLIDASEDESKLVVLTTSDVEPGQYFHLDRASNRMSPLFAVRSQLEGVKLATVTPISYRAKDGTQVPGYLTLPPGSSGKKLPAIVMPHGGPSARDEWGFDWLAQYFANQGYAVLQPNYRGSSGYGDAWFRNMGFKAWDVAIGDVNDAGRWLVAQGIADPAKLAIVGWSYGGYAALQAGVTAPDLFKAIVAIAPVSDLASLKVQARDQYNYRAEQEFIGAGPHIVAGSPAQQAAKMIAPVLLFHGDYDQNVAIAQSRLMQDKLRAAGKRVEFVEFPGLAHGLNDSVARTTLLERSETFLRGVMGM
ncbi:MAG: alpha/beta hydrolase family protein [Sphingomonadaceae bacterium]